MSTQDGGGKGEAGTERVGSRPSAELSFTCMLDEAERGRGEGRGGLLLACFHSRICYSSTICFYTQTQGIQICSSAADLEIRFMSMKKSGSGSVFVREGGGERDGAP